MENGEAEFGNKENNGIFAEQFFERGLRSDGECGTKKVGAIAQLVEQRTENPCVPGSIPGGTTPSPRDPVFPHFLRAQGLTFSKTFGCRQISLGHRFFDVPELCFTISGLLMKR